MQDSVLCQRIIMSVAAFKSSASCLNTDLVAYTLALQRVSDKDLTTKPCGGKASFNICQHQMQTRNCTLSACRNANYDVTAKQLQAA